MNDYVGQDDILKELQQRVEDKILEPSNYDLLKKLVENADTLDEAIKIAELGTTYRRTGFHFDKKLEKQSDTISYFKKNEELSFTTDPDAITHKLIIGDNYPALLNLLVEYKGKIDIIYIDPPYGKDSMGEFAQTNYENAISRDNLLSMLYPRLWLAKQLLSEKGAIFCSIDDRNYAYLKGLFDEVFGESKGETYIWCLQDKSETSFVKTASKTVRKEHEYILAYFTGEKAFGKYAAKRDFQDGKEFPNPDNDPRGGWFSGNISRNGIKTTTGSKYYTITTPTGKQYSRNWTLSKEEYEEAVKNNDIYFSKNGDGVPRLKIFPDSKNWLIQSSLFSDVKTSITGRKTVVDILGSEFFDFPKPVELISRLLELFQNDSATVLDFFAGSGTTGHALLEMNKADGGKRKFILVTNNEVTETTPNGIAHDVTSRRLKRVMTGEDYSGDNSFKWLEKNKPYGNNLLVVDIAEVSNREAIEGKTAFDVIDETLYGQDKLDVNEKIKWVATNFEQTQKRLEEK